MHYTATDRLGENDGVYQSTKHPCLEEESQIHGGGQPYSIGTSCWNTKESKVVMEDARMKMFNQRCGTSHSCCACKLNST